MCHNQPVLISQRWLAAAVLVLLALCAPRAGLAQGVAVAGLRVGARVAPACSILAEPSDADAGNSASVRVMCGRSALRALRVSMASGSGDDVTPVATLAGRQRLSGGEVVFTVPNLVATLASLRPVLGLPHATEPPTVVVTLQF